MANSLQRLGTRPQTADRCRQCGGRPAARTIAICPPLAPEHRVHMDPNEVFRMAFTSGTTGDPKCVLHSFNTTIYALWLLNRDMAVTERDVLLTYLPVGLNWGYITLMQTIMAGARAVLMERFSAARRWSIIERERVTYIPTAPAAIVPCWPSRSSTVSTSPRCAW